MGMIMRNGKPLSGSSNDANNIEYKDEKTVRTVIEELEVRRTVEATFPVVQSDTYNKGATKTVHISDDAWKTRRVIGATVINAGTPTYVPNFFVIGVSHLDGDSGVYVRINNAGSSNLTTSLQLAIYYENV